MDCQKIETSLNKLKADSLKRIHNKSKVMNEIYSMHLTKLDNVLTDIRIKVAHIGNSKDLQQVDEIIYKIQNS